MLTTFPWGHIATDDHLFEAVLSDTTTLFQVRKPVSGSYFLLTSVSKSVPARAWQDIMKAHAEWLKGKR